MEDIVRRYETDDLVIVWKPRLCTHAGVCVLMLPKVYHPSKRPWVTPQFATTEELIEQIDACPTGALSYELKK